MTELESTDSIGGVKTQDKDKIVSRKVGEKLRRDRLNSLLVKLAEEVPFVAASPRRLDKTAILRLTVSYLKLHHGLKRKRLQKALLDKSYLGLFEQAVSGSLLITAENGEILFISPNIKDFVGHYQTDLIGRNISEFIHPDELQIFKSKFQEQHQQSSTASYASFQANGKDNGPSNMKLLESSDSENFSMYVRFSKAVTKRLQTVSPTDYELFNVRGHIDHRKSHIDDTGLMWMVAVIKPVGSQAIREVDIGMSEFLKNNEWASQHGLDGKLWTVDQRGSLYHGYMMSELLGNTPYVFIKDEDLEYVARSHQLIMKENEIPSTVFRMKNKYSLNLYVQSRSIIINDRWTKQPKCIVSVNTVLSAEEGRRLLEEQRIRVEKLTAQTEQLALTEVKQELPSQPHGDGLCNRDVSESEIGIRSNNNQERPILNMSDELLTELDEATAHNDTISSSHLENSHSCFCQGHSDISLSTSGDKFSLERVLNNSVCYCSDLYQDLNLVSKSRDFNALVSPISLSGASNSSALSHNMKRPREDMETDSGNTDSEEEMFNCSDPLSKNCSQYLQISAHSLNNCLVKEESHSENQPRIGELCPILKKMLEN